MALIRFTSYLVHSAPALRWLYLPLTVEGDEYLEPLSVLRGLQHLQGLYFGTYRCYRQGAMAKFWKNEDDDRGMRVWRKKSSGNSIWGRHFWPKPTRSWGAQWVDGLMEAGALQDEDVPAFFVHHKGEQQMFQFREVVDGVSGREAFFAAFDPQFDRASKRQRAGGMD